MLVPDTLTVPWLGGDVTATELALPVIDSGSGLLPLSATTEAVTLATVGANTGGAETVMLALATDEVPPRLLAV
jgi:hypothetical protein